MQRTFAPIKHLRVAALLLGACTHAALAQAPGGQTGTALERVVVTATPLASPALSVDRLPFDTQTAGAEELRKQAPLTIAGFMDRNFSGVTINEAQSNPFQPDVSFRGFTASPLLGSPIGLSVFVDGVRVNESFGDTVQWDLLPTDSLTYVALLPGANPVFGLNTLGGVLAMHTTSGRESPGATADVMVGSFDRRSVKAAIGGASDSFDGYLGGRYYDEDGWRDFSPSQVRQVFAKGGWQNMDTRIELSYTRADNELIGNGLVPKSLQLERREAVYTHPDRSEPKLDFFNLTARHAWSSALQVSANAYVRRLRVETFNGDAEFEDGDTPTDPADDEYEAENRSVSTRQRTEGATLQLTYSAAVAGVDNVLTAGASWDRGRTDFDQFSQEAAFTGDRGTTADGELELDTSVHGSSEYLGLYLTDTFSPTERLGLTIAGRYNRADVSVEDRSGEEPELNGRHRFERFNPSAGFTYRIADRVTAFGGYSEGMRAPTPVELTCADPDDPCSLPVGFVADPPLDPVIARSWEGGLRGGSEALAWTVVGYTSDLRDDILFTAVGTSQGFFTNVDKTRRRGFSLSAHGDLGRLDWRVSYARVDATFETDVELFNPVANPADPDQPPTISVRRGDRFSGVPKHTFKLGADVELIRGLTAGIDLQSASDQYFRGDESNQHDTLPGYTVVNLNASYELSPSIRIYARLDNIFDRDYATLGAFNRNGFDADGPLEGAGPGPVERFISPAVPRSFWLGVELGLGRAATQ